MESFTAVQLAFNCVEPEGCENEKPPIIFIHGVTASKEFWNDIPQNVANATKRKVYAVDLRNHGDTEWSDTFSFDCNVYDLLNFMDFIQAPKAVLVGHSLGGGAAILTALTTPERVEKVVVEDISVKKISPEIHEMVLLHMKLTQVAIQKLPAGVDEETAKEFIVNFVYNGLPPEIQKLAKKPSPKDLNGKLKPTEDGRYTFKANITALEKAVENAKGRASEVKGVFEGPACFIYGKMSPFLVGADEEIIKKNFPNAELVGIDNATHLVHSDCPEEFTETLLKFLSIE